VDELPLALQRWIDRVIRRLRRGAAPAPTDRRFLIVQIDGLSRAVLEYALASGRMPFLAHLLSRHGYRVAPMAVGLPTSTAAFQMAAMYGVQPDIPAFHYYDRTRRTDVHFPRPGHAAQVEAEHASERCGILEGGSAYGCVFTGGAENNLFSFARLGRPTGAGLLCAASAFVVLGWVVVKSGVHTLIELLRAALRFLADPVGQWGGWRWLTIKITLTVWVRALFTLAVARDLYLGTRAVYVNYLEYDVAAHAFGPRSRAALRTLSGVDRSLGQLWRVLRRVPEHRYDLYILADHGQAPCVPYRKVREGQRLERWVFDEFFAPSRAVPAPAHPPSGLAQGIRARRRDVAGWFQRFANYLDEEFLRRTDPEAHERAGVRVIAAGPNALLYAVDAPKPLGIAAIEARFPGLACGLSRSAGVGFVLARSEDGAVCFFRGHRYRLGDGEAGPFEGRADATLVVEGIRDLMAMPSAGDLVIYGIDAPEGHVSYIPEVGAHAGPSPDEMHTFIVYAAGVTLPSPITHPVQLYDHFIRYHPRHSEERP
jgi:hypothetical protein